VQTLVPPKKKKKKQNNKKKEKKKKKDIKWESNLFGLAEWLA
jgi:hypothetical protein